MRVYLIALVALAPPFYILLKTTAAGTLTCQMSYFSENQLFTTLVLLFYIVLINISMAYKLICVVREGGYVI